MSDGPGFIFWGLFLVFGMVVVAYVVWMLWVERREGNRQDAPDPRRGNAPP